MKSILKNWHRYLLWLVVSFFFWAWIFTLITDAPAQKKLVLYADCPAMEREALDAVLEKAMPEGIRFVEARIFSALAGTPYSRSVSSQSSMKARAGYGLFVIT